MKKRGPPLKLGEKMDVQVQAYIKALREKGGVVNTAIVMAVAQGIVLKVDRNSLAEFGGHILLTKDWGKSPAPNGVREATGHNEKQSVCRKL